MGAPSHGTHVNYKTRKVHCNGQALPLYLVQGHWQQQSLLCTFIEFGNNDTKNKCLSNAVVSTAGSMERPQWKTASTTTLQKPHFQWKQHKSLPNK